MRQAGSSSSAGSPSASASWPWAARSRWAYLALQGAIIRAQGSASTLALALGRDLKGKVSPLLDALGIGLAFADRWLSIASYVTVALMWLIPGHRVERTLTPAPRSPDAPPEP